MNEEKALYETQGINTEEEYTSDVADQALFLTLLTAQVALTLQQEYNNGKIANLAAYNRLYEVVRKADVQARKLQEMLEHLEHEEIQKDVIFELACNHLNTKETGDLIKQLQKQKTRAEEAHGSYTEMLLGNLSDHPF